MMGLSRLSVDPCAKYAPYHGAQIDVGNREV